MSANDVLRLYDLLEREGIKIWIDGGWAVDADVTALCERFGIELPEEYR